MLPVQYASTINIGVLDGQHLVLLLSKHEYREFSSEQECEANVCVTDLVDWGASEFDAKFRLRIEKQSLGMSSVRTCYTNF